MKSFNLIYFILLIEEVIGGGAFGVVYKGVVYGKTVAIKVLKRDIVNKEMFKTFLVELKIMAFVNFIKGGHENIIRLIGAYTEEIRNCEFGKMIVIVQ
jgi:serine/threonine protein kinase